METAVERLIELIVANGERGLKLETVFRVEREAKDKFRLLLLLFVLRDREELDGVVH